MGFLSGFSKVGFEEKYSQIFYCLISDIRDLWNDEKPFFYYVLIIKMYSSRPKTSETDDEHRWHYQQHSLTAIGNIHYDN